MDYQGDIDEEKGYNYKGIAIKARDATGFMSWLQIPRLIYLGLIIAKRQKISNIFAVFPDATFLISGFFLQSYPEGRW